MNPGISQKTCGIEHWRDCELTAGLRIVRDRGDAYAGEMHGQSVGDWLEETHGLRLQDRVRGGRDDAQARHHVTLNPLDAIEHSRQGAARYYGDAIDRLRC